MDALHSCGLVQRTAAANARSLCPAVNGCAEKEVSGPPGLEMCGQVPATCLRAHACKRALGCSEQRGSASMGEDEVGDRHGSQSIGLAAVGQAMPPEFLPD